MEEIIKIIVNMQLGEIFDELDLLDGREEPENKLLRNLLLCELERRKVHGRI